MNEHPNLPFIFFLRRCERRFRLVGLLQPPDPSPPRLGVVVRFRIYLSVYSTPQSRFSDSITAISHSHRRFIPLPKVDFRTPSPPSSHLRHRLQGRYEGVDLPVVEINNSLMLHVVVGAGPFPSLLSPMIFSSRFRAKAIALSPEMHWISNIVVGLYFLSVMTKFGIRKVTEAATDIPSQRRYAKIHRQIDRVNPTDTDFQNCSFRCILKHPTNMATPFNTTYQGIEKDKQDGDIINIDVTVYLDGYHADTSKTFLCRNVDEATKRLLEVTEQCLERVAFRYYNRFRHMGNNRYCSMPNLQLRIRTYGI
ncbi:unnamed protein product [Lactuca virosa]|uniref:Peptidase M24 domain-containing protein n=1 Tax=Lactuca virosa TaxID=75947 RepID=A0AAU9MFJ1_9ASTR|nr:unnamed protein product [Lactuca virosa]